MPAQGLLIIKSLNVPSSSCNILLVPTYAAEFLEFRKVLSGFGVYLGSYISPHPHFFLSLSLFMSSYSLTISPLLPTCMWLLCLYTCAHIHIYTYITWVIAFLSIISMMICITIFINFIPLEVNCEIVYAMNKCREQSSILFLVYWWGKLLLKISIL